jgi:hypothetical protein
MKKLDTYKEFTYIYYESCDKLKSEYDRMYKTLIANGHALESSIWPLESGILLENENEVIAGSFFNLKSRVSSILMYLVFVEEPHRKNGIYKNMHLLVNRLGKEQGKTSIYSYIHLDNSVMQDHVAKNIGYIPLMHVVRKDIK